MGIDTLFVTLIYQPFFNLLIFIYWVLGLGGRTADMGIAVIILTLFIRFLLLPMVFTSTRSEADRRRIAQEIKDLEDQHLGDPVAIKKRRKKIFRKNPAIIVSEILTLVVQVTIALMLWKMFGTGLEGHDIDLLYPFMPQVEYPFNLMFLGRFDLSEPSLVLNLVQSLSIFVLETVAIYTSPYPPSKGEVVRMQLTLPLVSFLLFLGLPAGKKLFVIVTLWVSTVIVIARAIRRRFLDYKFAQEAAAAEQSASDQSDQSSETFLVDTK